MVIIDIGRIGLHHAAQVVVVVGGFQIGAIGRTAVQSLPGLARGKLGLDGQRAQSTP